MTDCNNIIPEIVPATVLQQKVQFLQEFTNGVFFDKQKRVSWVDKDPHKYFTYFLYDYQDRPIETGKLYFHKSGLSTMYGISYRPQQEIDEFFRTHPSRHNIQRAVYDEPTEETPTETLLPQSVEDNQPEVQQSFLTDENNVNTPPATGMLSLMQSEGFPTYKLHNQAPSPQSVQHTAPSQSVQVFSCYHYFITRQLAYNDDQAITYTDELQPYLAVYPFTPVIYHLPGPQQYANSYSDLQSFDYNHLNRTTSVRHCQLLCSTGTSPPPDGAHICAS